MIIKDENQDINEWIEYLSINEKEEIRNLNHLDNVLSNIPTQEE
jgi:hypothetical protein